MAACNIEVDICTLKQQRAKSRVRDIAVKRAEYQRARSVPRSRSSAPADRVKPHRIARTVTRSFVAKGLVQSEVDMPSITSMERSTSAHSRKKPSVAAMVSCGANPFVEESSIPLNACSDAEVVAFVGKNLKKPAVRIPGLALLTVNVACAAVCGPASGEGSVQEQVESLSVRRKVEEDEATEPSNEDCMAMVASDPGQDICAFKMRRAESRKRHIAAKRVDYQRARATPRARSSDPADRVKPHRIARTAARSFVAKGFVEGESDMPSLTSMGEPSSAHSRKKPSVASLVQCGAAPCLEKSAFPIDDVSDFETTASEGEEVNKELPALRTAVASDSESGVESKLAVDRSNVQELETPHSDEQEQQEEGELKQEVKEEAEVCGKECGITGVEDKPSKGNQTPTRREQVLRTLVDQLRAQSKEERRRASEAHAQKENLEEQLRSVEAKASKASKASKVQEKKVALQLEKRHAAEVRKRRNQEQQLRHLKEKADSALQAAERMREEAEAEAIAAKAHHLAEAEAVAQREAEAFALAEAERVRHHTEELVQQRMDELAQAKATLEASAAAEAEAIKAQAASEAQKAQALVEQMKAQTEDELRSMKVRAEVESRVIKARAEMEARATKAALEAERRAHLEAQAREQAQADARAQAELAAQEEAAREAQRREEIAAQKEAAAARKRAKELEQQRAKQFRKQQQQERKRTQMKEQELEAARAKAKEESDALRARALAEASALKAIAEAEARAIRAKAEAEAVANAKEQAQAKIDVEAQQPQAEAEQQEEQPLQQEPECELVPSEAKVEREFVGNFLDFEIQEAECADEEANQEAASSTQPELEESGWEVLPTADSRPSSGRGSSKGWWNIFF